VEASGPDGAVRLSFNISRERPGSGCFLIEDDGEGISPDLEDRLGEPFLTTKQNHTGLGLALAGRLLQFHGGSWEGENRPGRGAQFRIHLPLRRKENSA
jgi:signal transduction histidine kinase